MKRTVLLLSVLLSAPAQAAFLGGNPRLGESFLNTSIEQVAGELSHEGLRISGGAWFGEAAEFCKAPGEPGWPGNDPAQAPPGTEWKGQPGSTPGGGQGSYHGPDGSFYPDLDHPPPVGPHWDWKAPDGTWYRIMPDGTIVPK